MYVASLSVHVGGSGEVMCKSILRLNVDWAVGPFGRIVGIQCTILLGLHQRQLEMHPTTVQLHTRAPPSSPTTYITLRKRSTWIDWGSCRRRRCWARCARRGRVPLLSQCNRRPWQRGGQPLSRPQDLQTWWLARTLGKFHHQLDVLLNYAHFTCKCKLFHVLTPRDCSTILVRPDCANPKNVFWGCAFSTHAHPTPDRQQ